MDYGARVEVGILKEKSGSGWRVESLSRPGVVTPPLAVWPHCVERDTAFYAGEKVFFFLMEDGTGMVLNKAE